MLHEFFPTPLGEASHKPLKDPADDFLRVIPLGGCGEIGRNTTVYETKDDIVVVDAGVQFPEEEMLGVDLVINDMSYLLERRNKVRGLVLTHAHEDHIGGVPFFLAQLNVPVFGTDVTLALLRGKLREHKLLAESDLRVVDPGDTVTVGAIAVEFITVTHSVSGSCSLALRTPLGTVIHTGDFKFDQTPIDNRPTDMASLAAHGRDGVLLLASDSTNAELPGHTLSERVVGETFNDIFAQCSGRIIITMFASNVPRLQQTVDAATRHHRKVCFVGRSMQNVSGIALEHGYLEIPHGVQIRDHEIDNYPDDKLVICTTGSQGEPMSALVRMAADDYKRVKLKRGDTVIISATPIPGNERSIGRTINNLFKLGVNVIYGQQRRAHVSGHGRQEELLLMLNLTQPKYFLPVHGEYRMLVQHARLAERVGIVPENIFVAENGDALEITRTGARFGGRISGAPVYVDGLGVGDVGAVVLRDRRHLSGDGMIVITVTIDSVDGKVLAGPDITSRGFTYGGDGDGVLDEVRREASRIMEEGAKHSLTEWTAIRERVHKGLQKFIYDRTKRRPMIVPVVMEV
ncbi:MAG TPA: ribonuclease J [Candidatus Eremiobacteraceae bacterium]|nr:ribonuclease J [Candidatus Eremiobacteraceae bacterium]